MPFIHPAILWTGLGAVSVPILIHLLNRRRFRLRDWAAMKFLLESVRKNRRRLRIEELILLAIRCLLIVLLAMALARLTGCAAMDILPTGRRSQTVVYVLDDSYSMGQKLGNTTVFSAATTDLVQQLEGLPKSYKAAVLLTSKPDPERAFFALNFITDVRSLTDRAKSLEPSDKRAHLPDSLEAAEKIFKGIDGPKRLYLLSDFRRIDLTSRDEMQAIEKQFQALKQLGVEIFALDYSRPAGHNLTVQEVDLLDRFAAADTPARLRVTVRNNGPNRVEKVNLSLVSRMKRGEKFVEGQLPVQEIPFIDAGELKSVECSFTPGAPGSVILTGTLPPDGLPGDNAGYLALDVRETKRVLLVDGRPDVTDRTRSESFFFLFAVDPRGDGSYGVTSDVVTYDGLNAVNFEDYDVVVLLNLASLPLGGSAKDPYPQLQALERYVRDGGGLAIFTGDRIDHKFYNDRLWAKGEGLIPYRLRTRVGSEAPGEEYYKLDPRSLVTEDVLQVYKGDMSLASGLIRFFAFTQVDEMAAAPRAPHVKPPRVLARFTDPESSPAIASRQFGKGLVLMFYSTASKRWNDWPIDPLRTYTVMLTDMLSHLARAQRAYSAPVGEPIAHQVPPGLLAAVATLRTPAYPKEEEITLVPQREETPPVFRYDRTDAAGCYTLTLTAPARDATDILFARNTDPAEGDLTPGGKAAVAAAFGSEEFQYRQMFSEQTTATLQARDQREYWPWVIGALLALLAAELVLGQRFGHYSDAKTGPVR
ncbi:MAG TPA: BatA domain-containing protein [Phycisphaerae bacterium]|nr:BatA domain-containing protein [Phycisphaerae bacterium]